MPLISVVMPAYNAEKHIREAIESVIKQTFSDWELIIVDDCSTDNTFLIASRFAEFEPRIQLFKLESNSGVAQIPRCMAISKAAGDWILGLDADDYIDQYDLEKLYLRAVHTQADIVLHRLVRVTENRTIHGESIPNKDFDMNSTFTGRQACMLTIGGWTLSGNGIFKRELYVNMQINKKEAQANDDEYTTRVLFLNACKVALCDVNYYYRINLNSVTQKVTLKRFDVLDADRDLDKLIKNEFGEHSIEYSKMCNQRLYHLVEMFLFYFKNKSRFSSEKRVYVFFMLKKHYADIDKKKCKLGLIRTLLLLNGVNLFVLVCCLHSFIKR